MYRKALQCVKLSVLLPGRCLCTSTGKKTSGLRRCLCTSTWKKTSGLSRCLCSNTWKKTSGLSRCLCTSTGKKKKTSGLSSIAQQIKFSGPITVAEYMKQCLLHPVFGYYMQGDVFGKKGDFITAPEVSQVFGELLAVWVLADWKFHGEQLPVQLVELGPGRGTLINDMLRVFRHEQLQSILQGLSVHLVEASPAMAALQARTIQANSVTTLSSSFLPTEGNCYQSAMVDGDVKVYWYKQLLDVPSEHSYFIALEFFDALPIHQFQMTESGWREVLIDIDHTHIPQTALRFVLAPAETPASITYSSLATTLEVEKGIWLEVCPQGLLCAQELAKRVVQGGGAALVADYGGGGAKNTLRSFKDHALHEVLNSPGTADLTADVDFNALAKAAAGRGAGCCGPVTQTEFLHKLGIRERLEVLMKGATPSQAKDLASGYEVLTSPQMMGERFNLFSITSSPHHTPTPFL